MTTGRDYFTVRPLDETADSAIVQKPKVAEDDDERSAHEDSVPTSEIHTEVKVTPFERSDLADEVSSHGSGRPTLDTHSDDVQADADSDNVPIVANAETANERVTETSEAQISDDRRQVSYDSGVDDALGDSGLIIPDGSANAPLERNIDEVLNELDSRVAVEIRGETDSASPEQRLDALDGIIADEVLSAEGKDIADEHGRATDYTLFEQRLSRDDDDIADELLRDSAHEVQIETPGGSDVDYPGTMMAPEVSGSSAETSVRPAICWFDEHALSAGVNSSPLAETYGVEYFSTAADAVAAIKASDYRAVITTQESISSILSCFEFIAAIRGLNDEEKRQLPIIVITSPELSHNANVLLKAGASRVINGTDAELATLDLDELLSADFGSGYALEESFVDGSGETNDAAMNESYAAPAAVIDETRTGFSDSGSHEQRTEKRVFFDNAPTPSLSPAREAWDNVQRWARTTGGRFVLGGMFVIVLAALIISLIPDTTITAPRTLQGADVADPANAPGTSAAVVRGQRLHGRVISERQVSLTSQVAGQLAEVFVAEGMNVGQSTVLARLDDRKAQLGVDFVKAKLINADSEIRFIETSLKRLKTSIRRGEVSETLIDGVKAELNVAKGKRRMVEEELRAAKLEKERLNVVAPFDGLIAQSYATEGVWSEPPGALFKLVDMDAKQILLKTTEAVAHNLVVGQTLLLSSHAFPDFQWKEQIVKINHDHETLHDDSPTSVFVTLGPDAPPLRYGQQIDAQALSD